MATAPKAAAKKKPGTAVVAWDEALAARAAMAKKAEASVSTGSFISFKSGVMSYQGNPVPGNSLQIIVLSSIMENNFFEGSYDSNTPQSPVCYAFGHDEEEMAPHEAVEEPQCETCAGCPHNEWGSADKGNGKACKNVRRLAVITADTLDGGAETLHDAEVAYVKLPVTSVKGWAGFVNQLAATNKPPLAFVAEMSVVPDAKTQFKVTFKAIEEIDDGELIGALLEKADLVDTQIAFPYQKVEVAAKPQRAAKPAAKRTPAKAAPAKTAAAAKPARAPAARPAAARAPAAAPAGRHRNKF
jgi:hypothetical protein